MKNKKIAKSCPYCGDINPVVYGSYVRCQIFGCYTYLHGDNLLKNWNSPSYRAGIQRALMVLKAQGKIK